MFQEISTFLLLIHDRERCGSINQLRIADPHLRHSVVHGGSWVDAIPDPIVRWKIWSRCNGLCHKSVEWNKRGIIVVADTYKDLDQRIDHLLPLWVVVALTSPPSLSHKWSTEHELNHRLLFLHIIEKRAKLLVPCSNVDGSTIVQSLLDIVGANQYRHHIGVKVEDIVLPA